MRECVFGAVEGEELPCQGRRRAVHPFHWIRILLLALLVSPCICQRNGHGLLNSSWCHSIVSDALSLVEARFWDAGSDLQLIGT